MKSHSPSVIVVTHNSADLLPELITSLETGFDRPAHVVFIDNASTDSTLATLAKERPDARVIEMGRNAGYAAAINAALETIGPGSPVLVLNPDVRLSPKSGDRLMSLLTADEVGVAVPRIVNPPGELARSLRRWPTIPRALAEALLGGTLAGRLGLGEVITDPAAYQHPRDVAWASGAAWAISPACISAVGKWDESFFLYSEETDYARRAWQAGFAVRYVPGAVVTHIGGDAHRSPSLFALLTVNRVRWYRKHHSIPSSFVFFAIVLLGSSLRALMGRKTHRQALRALLRWGATGRPPSIGSRGTSELGPQQTRRGAE